MKLPVTADDTLRSLKDAFSKLTSDIKITDDQWGNCFFWVYLDTTDHLQDAAALLAQFEARLCTVTAMSRVLDPTPTIVLDYHFDVNGAVITVAVPLNSSTNSVPTITPWFLNSDWNEREAAELYGIRIDGNQNPNRLFLDESIDQGILNNIIPLSTVMNGACTTDLWEHVMSMNQTASDNKENAPSDGNPDPKRDPSDNNSKEIRV